MTQPISSENINKTLQSNQLLQLQPEEEQEEEDDDEVHFDPDDQNQKFFNLADVKPLDFKAKWIGDTNQVISKFQNQLSQLQKHKSITKEQFLKFAENENRFKISSLRKINIVFNKKEMYNEYMKITRRTIEKLHPSLIINICSYVTENVFLALAKLRRVSKIFNIIYNNDKIIRFFSESNFGVQNMDLVEQQNWCMGYIVFKETFLYYKQIKYTVIIPQNSIKQDIEKAVNFINQVYKHAFMLKSIHFEYFDVTNHFMKHHRVVLALQALTFTDMAVTKKASIIAFSNYLAFNASARQKQQITKTKYLKMIQMVQDEHYRDSLFINSKISNFLMEEYNYEFSAFIDTLNSAQQMSQPQMYDLVVYHLHNDLISSLSKGVILSENAIQIGDVSVQFREKELFCCLTYKIGNRIEYELLRRQYLPTFGKGNKFGDCYIYRGEFYYVLLIKPPQQQNQDDYE